jgi:hypothetical protein
VYIIEDVTMKDMRLYQELFHHSALRVEFVNLLRPKNALRDNSLIAIRKPLEVDFEWIAREPGDPTLATN